MVKAEDDAGLFGNMFTLFDVNMTDSLSPSDL